MTSPRIVNSNNSEINSETQNSGRKIRKFCPNSSNFPLNQGINRESRKSRHISLQSATCKQFCWSALLGQGKEQGFSVTDCACAPAANRVMRLPLCLCREVKERGSKSVPWKIIPESSWPEMPFRDCDRTLMIV